MKSRPPATGRNQPGRALGADRGDLHHDGAEDRAAEQAVDDGAGADLLAVGEVAVLQAERPQAVVGDEDGQHQGGGAGGAVRRAQPGRRRDRQLAVEDQRAEPLDEHEHADRRCVTTTFIWITVWKPRVVVPSASGRGTRPKTPMSTATAAPAANAVSGTVMPACLGRRGRRSRGVRHGTSIPPAGAGWEQRAAAETRRASAVARVRRYDRRHVRPQDRPRPRR